MGATPPPVETSATRARQGRSGLPMIWVLSGSLVLACVALLAVWALRWGDLGRAHSRTSVSHSEAATFHASPRSGG